MIEQHLLEMLTQTRRLRRRFASTAAMPWDAVTAAAELAVQLGHLATCLLRQLGTTLPEMHDPLRPIDDVGDELADVVLAALSVCVLADTRPVPTAADIDGDIDVTELYLRLAIDAGRLAEAAMIRSGYRHRPTGMEVTVSAAAGRVLARCGAIAAQSGLDLVEQFERMVADTDRFLDTRAVRS